MSKEVEEKGASKRKKEPIKLEIKPVWEQQQGEPTIWYERFHAYLLKGPKRRRLTVYQEEKAREKPTADEDERLLKAPEGSIKWVPSAWRKASNLYRWIERATAYDNHLLEEERGEWEEKHKQDRKTEHEMGLKLDTRIKEMLDFPLAEIEYPKGYQIIEDPKRREDILKELSKEASMEAMEILEQMPLIVVQVTTIKPIRWNARDIVITAEISSQLKRRATGAPVPSVTGKTDTRMYDGRETEGRKGAGLLPNIINNIIVVDAPKKAMGKLESGQRQLDLPPAVEVEATEGSSED